MARQYNVDIRFIPHRRLCLDVSWPFIFWHGGLNGQAAHQGKRQNSEMKWNEIDESAEPFV